MFAYFERMIEILSIMCMNRNFPATKAICKLYSLDFAFQNLLDENIPPMLRANLTALLLHTYIDRDPYETMNVPNLAREWH